VGAGAADPLRSHGLNANILVRMRGLEPPPGLPDTDLNRARLPIPPHPRVGERAKISHRRGAGRAAGSYLTSSRRRSIRGGLVASALLASTQPTARRYRPGD
jgi:hypothetical protein